MKGNTTYVYDIESYLHYFCVVAKKISTGEIFTFEISRRKDEREELLKFLRYKAKFMVGFNNINYDYPMLHWFMNNHNKYITIPDLVAALHFHSNEIINAEFSSIKKPKIKQIDLFKINHYDNKAKATSLKALEIAMRMDKVLDLPYGITEYLSFEQMQEILEYCIHDTEATFKFFEMNKEAILLRYEISATYNIDVINASDAKMGEEILLHELAHDMGISPYELKQMRTYRDKLEFKDYILPYINFKNKEFNDLLNKLKSVVTNETKDAFKEEIIYKGFTFVYGQGGIHGCIKPGIYTPDEDEIILDLDVKSFYPNLAIVNDFRPKHLGKSFSKIYKGMYIKRASIPKSNPNNYTLKISLNGAYGKSNDKNSFLYDPAFTMKITLNGQLSLSMIIENIIDTVDCTLLQVNTDGFTIKCKKSDVELINKLTKAWEELTQLELESASYSKMIIRDVNNYIAVYDKTEISKEEYDKKLKTANKYAFNVTDKDSKYYIEKYKTKGAFEIERAWHKNHSMLVVPKAIFEFYIYGIDYKQYVNECTDIFDFCKRVKANKGTQIIERLINGVNITDINLQKNNRYIVSNIGVDLIKIMPPLDGKDSLLKDKESGQMNLFDFVDDVKIDIDREISVESGYKCNVLNNIVSYNTNIYDINYQYYIEEIEKITKLIN